MDTPQTTVQNEDAIDAGSGQDDLYLAAWREFGQAMSRLAASYEIDPEHREDLLQNIQLALWQSFANYAGKCSLRTWVYRVAHNTAATHVLRRKRVRQNRWVSIEELDSARDTFEAQSVLDNQALLRRVQSLVLQLKPVDRDVLLLYLEGFEPREIADVVGLSSNLVAQKVHRTKKQLKQKLAGDDDEHE